MVLRQALNLKRGVIREDRMRALAVYLIKDAVDKVQRLSVCPLREEAILFLQSAGAEEIFTQLDLDQDCVLSRLGIASDERD